MEIDSLVLNDAVARLEQRDPSDNSRPRFHWKSVEFKNESEKAGKQVFKDVEYVEIIVPGQRKSQVVCKVTDEHRRRWPAHYAAWKGNRESPTVGMPLEKWTLIGPSEVEMLRYQHVHTVEELANLTDAQLQDCGPGTRKLQTKAKAWVKQAQGNAGLSEALAKNEALEKRLSGMEAQLQQALEALAKGNQPEKPAKRTRARKPEAEAPPADEAEGEE